MLETQIAFVMFQIKLSSSLSTYMRLHGIYESIKNTLS